MRNQLIKKQSFGSLLRLFLLSIMMINMGACAVHKASFDCADGKGMGCGSMIDVHKAIKDNSFNQVESSSSTKKIKVCESCQKSNSTKVANIDSVEGDNKTAYSVKNKVSRSQDKIMRIWFNSYFDEHNNFHDNQYIYTIIQPSQWLVKG